MTDLAADALFALQVLLPLVAAALTYKLGYMSGYVSGKSDAETGGKT